MVTMVTMDTMVTMVTMVTMDTQSVTVGNRYLDKAIQYSTFTIEDENAKMSIKILMICGPILIAFRTQSAIF